MATPPATVDEYRAIRTHRGAAGQEVLEEEAFKSLADLVKVGNIQISLPEVAGHSFALRTYRPVSSNIGQKLPALLYLMEGTSAVETSIPEI